MILALFAGSINSYAKLDLKNIFEQRNLILNAIKNADEIMLLLFVMGME